MRAIRLSFIVTSLLPFFSFASADAATIRGTVKGVAGLPVAGAAVSASIHGSQKPADAPPVTTSSDATGAFAIEVACESCLLRVTHSGFRDETRLVTAGAEVSITLEPELAEAIVVSGIRADDRTPVTKTNVSREEIARTYYQQDIPLLLRDTPSVTTYTESGVGGSGYSYFTLRGVSPTRLNFTLDGVPLGDSEDNGTYFADFPDLARSLQSIQIQRGVGTSTVGAPSFGGSVNFESIDLSTSRQADARVATGSFGNRFATVGYQSGLLPGAIALYGRVSANESDGFRDSSGVRQHNVFFSASKSGQDSQLKLTGFSGHETSQLSFFAADEETLKTDLRANPLSPDDTDSFGYDLAQLQYLRSLSEHTSMTASVFYQRGYGAYRLYDDEETRSGLREYGLDGLLIGSTVTMSWSGGPLTANYGVHVNEFRREHTRDLVGGARDYYNYGTKSEANAFAKVGYDVAKWHLYGDAQVRHTDFHYHGDVAIDPISWTFFNPRVGARYDVTTRSSVYGSAGLSTREPTRNDLFQGEDNATVAHDLRAVKPERLFDLEAGWSFAMPGLTLTANAYAMEFHNEIASTGELSDIGLLLRRNVDRSYRRGLELDALWQVTAAVRLRTTANVSRNRIREWTQFYDVYDDAGNVVGSEPLVHRNVNPVLTPSVILTEALEVAASRRVALGAVGRYVAKSYLDNTNNDSFVAPSFFTLDGNVAVSLNEMLRLTLQVNNVLNNRRVFPSGYDYLYIGPDQKISGTSYYFPQATRNAVVMLDVKL
jgi:iron complex outermembrane receptor protein